MDLLQSVLRAIRDSCRVAKRVLEAQKAMYKHTVDLLQSVLRAIRDSCRVAKRVLEALVAW